MRTSRPACTANDCALVITPDGVRRPVAVSILTLLFALTGKLMVKDRIARRGPDGWAAECGHQEVSSFRAPLLYMVKKRGGCLQWS